MRSVSNLEVNPIFEISIGSNKNRSAATRKVATSINKPFRSHILLKLGGQVYYLDKGDH